MSYLKRNLSVNFGTYPNHVGLEVWVEAQNKLGAVNSSISNGDSERFGMYLFFFFLNEWNERNYVFLVLFKINASVSSFSKTEST